MKQVQSNTTLDHRVARGEAYNSLARQKYRRLGSYEETATANPAQPHFWMQSLVALLRGIWLTVSLPFRLVFWLIALLGRVTGVILGFLLMVVGMALWASPLFIVGIPIFVIGLVFTLRCLE